MIVLSVAKLIFFSTGKRNFSLNKGKNLFSGKFGSIPTFRNTRKGKKCFCDEPGLSDHKVLHNIASSSSVFYVTWIFSLFSLIFRTSKLLEFKEFYNTIIIIPFALVGYETVIANSYPKRLHGITVNYSYENVFFWVCLQKHGCWSHDQISSIKL